MSSSKVVPFASREVSQETVATLRYWMRQAELGHITGCVLAVSIGNGLDYDSGFAGKCKAHPIFTRGLILELLDEVRAMPDPNHL